MVTLIDRRVMLDPDQQQQIFEALRDNWRPRWSNVYVLLFYSNYASMPEPDVLSPHLSVAQQKMWAGRPRRRYASMLWQLHFGPSNVFGISGFPALADPKIDADVAEPQ